MAKYFIYSAIIFAMVNFFALSSGHERKVVYVFEHFNNSDKSSFTGPLNRDRLKDDKSIKTEIVNFVNSKAQCKAASKFAGLDLYDNTTDRTLNQYFLDTQYPREPMIKCNTIPTVYLRLGQSRNRSAIIMMDPSKFKNVHFRADLVQPKFEPKLCGALQRNNNRHLSLGQNESTCYEDKQLLRASTFSNFSSNDRLDLCVAAKSYLVSKKNIVDDLPKFQRHNVEPAKSFNIKSSAGYVKRVALKCPTFPPMYIYYQNERVTGDTRIILTKKSKP